MGLPAYREVLGLLNLDREVYRPQSIFSCYGLHQRRHRSGSSGTAGVYLTQVATTLAKKTRGGLAAHDRIFVCYRTVCSVWCVLTQYSVCVVSLIRVEQVVRGMKIVPTDGTWGMVANFIWL